MRQTIVRSNIDSGATNGTTTMARQGRQAARKPATKSAHLRKKMEKNQIVSKIGRKKVKKVARILGNTPQTGLCQEWVFW